MEFLFDNPIANMQGPLFLLFYGVTIVAVALIFHLFKSKFDWTVNHSVPLVPQNPDPYQVAFLRGGENELIRTLIFSLTQKGFLVIENNKKESYISQTAIQPNWTTLTDLERRILTYFQKVRETRQIFEDLAPIVKPHSAQYEQQMLKNNLLTPNDVSAKIRFVGFLLFTGLAMLGGYKLVAAIVKGHSNFLILLVFIVITYIIFWYLGKAKRLSVKGEKFLNSIQTAFSNLQSKKNYQNSVYNSFDPTLLALGIFGTSVLVGSSYNDFEQAFHKARATNASSCGSGSSCSSSCGSSCSSGGDGGSSCSSGCGGCGGGCS